MRDAPMRHGGMRKSKAAFLVSLAAWLSAGSAFLPCAPPHHGFARCRNLPWSQENVAGLIMRSRPARSEYHGSLRLRKGPKARLLGLLGMCAESADAPAQEEVAISPVQEEESEHLCAAIRVRVSVSSLRACVLHL